MYVFSLFPEWLSGHQAHDELNQARNLAQNLPMTGWYSQAAAAGIHLHELSCHTLSRSCPVSHETPWFRCRSCSWSFSRPEAEAGGATSHLPPHIWSSLPGPPHSPRLPHQLQHRLRLQQWRFPTALVSRSRTALCSSIASPCWRSHTTTWFLIQLWTQDTSAPAAACLPRLLWTPSASLPHPSRLLDLSKLLWTASSSAARLHLV